MSKRLYDVAKLVEHFGGRTMLHQKLTDAGMVLTIRAIDQWLYRGRVPTDAIATMLSLSVADGVPLDFNDFLKGTTKDRPVISEPISSLLD